MRTNEIVVEFGQFTCHIDRFGCVVNLPLLPDVKPEHIRDYIGFLRALLKALAGRDNSASSPHFHHWEDGTYYSHSHTRGKIPHGHQGARYGQPNRASILGHSGRR